MPWWRKPVLATGSSSSNSNSSFQDTRFFSILLEGLDFIHSLTLFFRRRSAVTELSERLPHVLHHAIYGAIYAEHC